MSREMLSFFLFYFGHYVDDKHLNGQNSDWKMKEASWTFTVWSFSITSERTDELKKSKLSRKWEGIFKKFNWSRGGNQYPCIACWTTEKISFPSLCLFFQQMLLNLVSTICFNSILHPAVWDIWLHRTLCWYIN